MARKFNGERLRELREKAGYTQTDLAKKVRYRNSGSISRIESGEQAPRLRKAKAMAVILKIKPEELYTEVPEEQKV